MKTRFIAGALALVLCALLAAILTRCIAPPVPTVTPTATSAPTAMPTASPTPTVTPSPTLTPTATPTASPTATATPAPAWTPVVALRHDAMDSVRYWFPERFAPPVVAWIAMQNCDHMGRYYELRLPDGRVYLARAVDCGQFAHRAAHREKWGDQTVIELDVNAWRRWGLSLAGGWMGGIREAPRPGGCFGRGAVTEVCAGGYQIMR